MRPSRGVRWGQNFLIDPNIQRKILALADIQPADRVLEIGPGRGMLTRGLMDRGAVLTAIEIDPTLGAQIQAEFPGATIVIGDALHHSYNFLPAPYKVVANLPYSVAVPLLMKLFEQRGRITKMVLMFQKEVAERLVAAPGSKAYGSLSVLAQFHAELSIVWSVPSSCFSPRPEVASSIVRVIPHSVPKTVVLDEAIFFRIVKGAFSHRRKQIHNALTDAGFPTDKTRQALSRARIDGARRAETLSLFNFSMLASAWQ